MKTKLLCIMLLVVISIFGLVGCGEKQPQNTTEPATTQTVGVIQGDTYVNAKAKFQFTLPESWDFTYDSPECDMSAESPTKNCSVQIGHFILKESEYSAEDTKLALEDLSSSVSSMLFDKDSATVTDMDLPVSFDSAFAKEINGTVMKTPLTQIIFYGQTGDNLVQGVITSPTSKDAHEILDYFSNIDS